MPNLPTFIFLEHFLNSQVLQNFCSEMPWKCESVYLLGPGVGANHTLPSDHKTAGTLAFLHGWVVIF